MDIHDLKKKYEKDRVSFLKIAYKETQLRNDFIDPFLKCLGWDVDNDNGKSLFLRDVVQEESIEVKDESTKKCPDYTLRINGTRKIFIEVKKPSVNILKSASAAFQTRRYGWSANLGISILTNFEYLIIYDCRTKPDVLDNEHIARYKVYSYKEYESAFEDLYKLISYDAVNSGSLDELFDMEVRKGEPFDEYFLLQIEDWRERLAESAIKNNNKLDEENINFIIQRLLNKIIFLRICEDRSIEKYETIKQINNYDELKCLFQNSDKKYNSGLFNFIEDELSYEAKFDDSLLISIFNELYYPQSPYDFSVVDSSILSQIYERFLGNKIIITNKRTIDVIKTPEVSASNGVVPTPKIIVEQIVKDTLSPLFKGKKYNDLKKLKIVDICCGSGTFLISAFDYLVENLLERYIEEDIKSDVVIETNNKELIFTLKAKRDILENNIFGVDINPYAVEVTEFSLLLKLLEGEKEATINNFIQQNSKKVLPDLRSSIKCGNSLVDSKFFNLFPEALTNDDVLFRVRPFDWNTEYKQIMINGGFDAIIGNPPYVRIQNMKKYSPEEIKYFQSPLSKYEVAKKATVDKYFVFIQRALELLNPTGFLGYIVPHKFFLTVGGKQLRKFITDRYQISKIIHFGAVQVFPNKSTYTAILILQRNKIKEFDLLKVDKLSSKSLCLTEKTFKYETYKFDSKPWVFLLPETERVFNKFESDDFVKLGNIAEIAVGLQTSADDIYIFVPEKETDETFCFNRDGIQYEIEKSICKNTIYDLSFHAFDSIEGNAQMIFPYEIHNEKASLISEENMQERYPLVWKYLSNYKNKLAKRKLQGRNPSWYQFGRSQSLTKFVDTEKLVWSVLATESPYVLDTKNLLFTGGGNGPYYGLINKSDYSLLYIMGILTHPIIECMVKAYASEFRGSYYSHSKQFLESLPIRKIDFLNCEDIVLYNDIIKSVDNLIGTTRQLKLEKNNSRKLILQRKIKTLNNGLINNINKLYQISDDDFSTVMNDELLFNTKGESE